MITGKDILKLADDLSAVCDAWPKDARNPQVVRAAFEELTSDEHHKAAGLFRVISIVTTGWADVARGTDGDLIGMTANGGHIISLMTATDPAMVSECVAREMVDGYMRNFEDFSMMPRRWYDVAVEYSETDGIERFKGEEA